MSKMTDEQIIKALERYKTIEDTDITTSCIKTILLKETYLLINRQQAEIDKYKNGIKKLMKKYQLYKENKIATREFEIEQAKIIEAGKKVFKATINEILSIKGHYANIDGEFVEIESPELLDELENLFGMEFCEFNEDYEVNLENLVKEMVGEGK